MLRATGIVRHIDELGRIVVPKEIRNTLRLKVGTGMEIFCSDGGDLVLKKYSPLDDISEIAESLCNSIRQHYPLTSVITGNDKVIAKCGKAADEIESTIPQKLVDILEKRQQTLITSNTEEYIDCKREISEMLVTPIIVRGLVFGGIVFLNFDQVQLGNEVSKLAKLTASIIASQFE
ncbi:MAG: stage V sporulation T C-terminal domain-containing protein [Clostridia bacterium]|nr:stage V sporulation T C-terminal domain-containing protein [Clostridia bacterium]